MRSYTHIAGAIVLFLSFAYLTNLNNLLVGILFASWISIFPDIFDRLLGKHRGYGHSIFWIIPCLLLAFFNVTIAIALIIGIISHVLLDVITTHGTPILYPLWKTNFVILNSKRRIKTGTNHDKAVFLVLIFLLIPIIYFTIGSMQINETSLNYVFASEDLTNNKSTDLNATESIKNNFNLNFQLNPKTNKNITVKKINDNETTVIVKDIEQGG